MFIYVMTCAVNGKPYVGYDTAPESDMRRYNLHVSSAVNRKPPKHRSKLYPAMIKYGPDKFTVRIVARTESIKRLKALEIKWIEKLDSIKNGYNIVPGGNGWAPFNSLDSEERAKAFEFRQRGSKNANKKRWANTTLKQRRKMLKNTHTLYDSARRSKNVKSYWDRLTAKEYAAHCAKMRVPKGSGRSAKYA